MRTMTYLVLLVAVAMTPVWASGAPESDGPVTLTIAGRDGSYGAAMKLAAEAYQAENPGVEFEILELSGSALFEQTVVDLRSGAASYDIILIDDPNAPQYMAAGWLADLDAMYRERGESIDSDFIGPALASAAFPPVTARSTRCLTLETSSFLPTAPISSRNTVLEPPSGGTISSKPHRCSMHPSRISRRFSSAVRRATRSSPGFFRSSGPSVAMSSTPMETW
jgi:hypothetical protein